MASTGEVWRLGRRPALDALRGVAVLLVVTGHALMGQHVFLSGGTVGVTVFFTLSGFLITSLLIEERTRVGSINFTSFYLRRARRLLPAMLVMVAVVTAFLAVVGLARPSLLPILLYVGNWPSAHGGPTTALHHMWSLAIEEQFYVVWPVVLALALRYATARTVVWICVLGAAASVCARVALWDGGAGEDRIYFGSDTRIDAMLIGCALAGVMHGSRSQRPKLPVALTPLVVLGLVPLGYIHSVILPTVVAILAATGIWCLVSGPADSESSAGPRWLQLVGQRSYGLYLWHFPILYLAVFYLDVQPGMGRGVAVVAALALSGTATELSWRYVEQPFLRRSAHPEPVERIASVR